MDTKEPKEKMMSTEDWFLQGLVSIVNKSPEISIGITLHVDGFLVSGHLVSGKRYFEGFAQEFGGRVPGVKNDPEKQIEKAVAQLGKSFYGDEAEKSGGRPVHYIHLEGARMFHPGGEAIPADRGIWWRGRLTCVAGFSLGLLHAKDE